MSDAQRGHFKRLCLCGQPESDSVHHRPQVSDEEHQYEPAPTEAELYGSRILVNGPARHRHDLPVGHDLDHIRPGAVAPCAGCGRLFLLDPIPWERTWKPLRWWHVRARRAVREATP